MDDPTAGGPPRWRTELRAFGELFALFGLAITQPVLDIFGRAPDHLIFRGVGSAEIVAFALITAFAVPTTIWLLECTAGLLSTTLRNSIHTLALWAGATVAITFLVDAVLTRRAALVFGALAAAGFVALHHWTRGPRIWLAFLSPAPLFFVVIFLFASPVAPLLRSNASGATATVGDPTRTIVIVFDELGLVNLLDEDAAIDADLFPNFARLADSSHWFRQATTVASSTEAAVPSMFTAIVPDKRVAPTAEAHPDNLLGLVRDDLPVVSAELITRLCSGAACQRVDSERGGLRALLSDARTVVGQRLDPLDPDVDVSRTMFEPDATADGIVSAGGEANLFQASGDGGLERIERFLDTIDDEPALHFLHVLLPHGPFRFLPDGTIYEDDDPRAGTFLDAWLDESVPVDLTRQRYLLQLQYTDQVLGQILDHLDEQDRWDDTNLVIASDHGFGLQPGGPIRGFADVSQGDESIAQILWVPFFVKVAGQTEGVVSDDPVRIVDVAPTVADLLDIDIPWSHDGRSAFDGGSGDADEVGMVLVNANRLGETFTEHRSIDRSAGWRHLLDRTTGWFAPEAPDITGTDRIYRRGPRPELWGQPVPDDMPAAQIDIAESSRTDGVDPSTGPLPILFRASTDTLDAGTDVAIAVDGIVWATTSVWTFRGTDRIDAVLPPQAYGTGPNDLTVHPVGG